MEAYHDLLRFILAKGTDKTDRTQTGTKSIFGYQMRFDLSDGFPLVTTKKVAIKSIIHELLWFLKGDSNLSYLAENNVPIWNEWPFKHFLIANNIKIPEINSETWKAQMTLFVEIIKNDPEFAQKWGNLGPIYGYQWRSWPSPSGGHIDQISQVLDQLKNTPDSRRMIVSAWNVSDIEEMSKAGLPPCHCLFQFYVSNNKLSCQLYQRSADAFLGVPFNIASYSLLTLMISQVVGLKPGEFIHTIGDAHIYNNHLEQVNLQLSRVPKPLPVMRINPEKKNLEEFIYEDFLLENYDPWPAIKAPVAV